MVPPYQGLLLSNTKEWNIDTHINPDEPLENCAEWRKPIQKGYMLYGSIFVTFLKWQNYRKGEQSSGHLDKVGLGGSWCD